MDMDYCPLPARVYCCIPLWGKAKIYYVFFKGTVDLRKYLQPKVGLGLKGAVVDCWVLLDAVGELCMLIDTFREL